MTQHVQMVFFFNVYDNGKVRHNSITCETSCNNYWNEFNSYNNTSKIIPYNPNSIEYPIYAPEWYLARIVSSDNCKMINNDIKNRNLLTDRLLNENQSLYLHLSEIIINAITGICTKDMDSFASKCYQMFPKGRVFMSCV